MLSGSAWISEMIELLKTLISLFSLKFVFCRPFLVYAFQFSSWQGFPVDFTSPLNSRMSKTYSLMLWLQEIVDAVDVDGFFDTLLRNGAHSALNCALERLSLMSAGHPDFLPNTGLISWNQIPFSITHSLKSKISSQDHFRPPCLALLRATSFKYFDFSDFRWFGLDQSGPYCNWKRPPA